MVSDYSRWLQQTDARVESGRVSATLQLEMSREDVRRYREAIVSELAVPGTVVSPAVLYRAASRSLDGRQCSIIARVGLQPGTMNPLHFGHISASLAGALVADLDAVVLAPGGMVPEKPLAAPVETRVRIARAAVRGLGVDRLRVTAVRHKVLEVFTKGAGLRHLWGENLPSLRLYADIAAFVWLFRANPNVTWIYVVGSDKVRGYGRKGEQNLILETLAKVGAQVLYFSRRGEEVDVERDIEPYEWMSKVWRTGMFKESELPSAVVSAVELRFAIVSGLPRIRGLPLDEYLSADAIELITNDPQLLGLYARECSASGSRGE